MELQIEGLKVDAGGEGSRGGKIIGHTTSGKPIYANSKHINVHRDVEKYSARDHKEAASAHHEKLLEHQEKRNTAPAEAKGFHKGSTDHHREMRNFHENEVDKKLAGAKKAIAKSERRVFKYRVGKSQRFKKE